MQVKRLIQKTNIVKNYTQKTSFKTKSSFPPKGISTSKPFKPLQNDFEKRKLAEQRATKRLKGELPQKGKSPTKRRELKLTISRALSDEDNERINEIFDEFEDDGFIPKKTIH